MLISGALFCTCSRIHIAIMTIVNQILICQLVGGLTCPLTFAVYGQEKCLYLRVRMYVCMNRLLDITITSNCWLSLNDLHALSLPGTHVCKARSGLSDVNYLASCKVAAVLPEDVCAVKPRIRE